MSQSAFAETLVWDAFEARCLQAVEDTGQADVSGLEPSDGSVHAAVLGTTNNFVVVAFHIADGVGLATLSEPDRPVHGCSVVTTRADLAEASAAHSQVWLTDELAAERWRKTGGSLLGPRYRRVWGGPQRLMFSTIEADGALVLALDHVKKDG